jgi:transaldolase
MEIFIDTAKLGEIKEALSWGIVGGVTTNPSLLREAIDEEKKKGRDVDLESHVGEICKLAGKGRPVSLEVLSQKASEMIEEAHILYKKFNPIAGNVVIKIPINTYTGPGVTNYEGLKAIRESGERKIPINATLVMTPEQALLAAKAGAMYASPFAGRVDDYIRENLGISFEKYDYFDFDLVRKIAREKLDRRLKKIGGDIISAYSDKIVRRTSCIGDNEGIASGVELVEKIVDIFRKYGIKTKVIAASMRHPRQVREVAEAGADIATVPFEVLQEMLKHPKTEEGVKKFYVDASRAKYEELFR